MFNGAWDQMVKTPDQPWDMPFRRNERLLIKVYPSSARTNVIVALLSPTFAPIERRHGWQHRLDPSARLVSFCYRVA